MLNINHHRPYRLAFITPVPVEGGAEINLLRLIKALDRQRVDPIKVLVHSGGTLAASYRSEGLNVNAFTFYKRDWKSPWRIAQTYSQLALPLLLSKPDLIQINLQYGLDYTAWLAQRIKIPFIIHVRGVETQGWKKKDIFWMELADKVVACSNAVKYSLIKSGLSEPKIKVIYDGLDTQAFLYEETEKEEDFPYFMDKSLKYIGMVGRVIPEKGIIDFIYAARLIKNHYPHVKFLVVGTGPEDFLLQVENITKELGLTEDIVFTGFIQHIANIMMNLDVLVLATHDPKNELVEAFPNNILEAMAAKTPVVASRSGGVVEQLAENRGILFTPGNSEELAQAIVSALSLSDNQREVMVERAYQAVVTKYSLREQANQFVSLYDEILTIKGL